MSPEPITGLAALLGAAMLIGCFVPRHLLPRRLPHDALLHIGAFGLMALPLAGWPATREVLPLAMLGLWLLGLLVELLQGLVPGRRFGADDLVYNAAGILLGTGIGLLLAQPAA
jgi:hypothetical protein